MTDGDNGDQDRRSSSDRLTPRETFLLYALFASRCGKCRRPLVLESERSGKPFNIGKRAHIIGRSEGGPRGDADIAPEDRGHLKNHVLLCGGCHDEIDQDEESWPLERLHGLRASHIAWIDERLSQNEEDVSDRVYAHLVASACELAGLDRWVAWTQSMFDPYRSWRPEQVEMVAEFVRRVGAADWPGSLPALETAIRRFAYCLSEAAGRFTDKAEMRDHDLYVPREYKRGGYNPNFHAEAEAFERWLQRYETLLVESSRAANWIRDEWRAAGHPLFMLGERAQIVTSANADDRLHFFVYEYSEAQKKVLLEAEDVRSVPVVPVEFGEPANPRLARLIHEILVAVTGAAPPEDVVRSVEEALRNNPGVLGAGDLFDAMPGRKPPAEAMKRVAYELSKAGVLVRNPGGRGWVVADLDP